MDSNTVEITEEWTPSIHTIDVDGVIPVIHHNYSRIPVVVIRDQGDNDEPSG